MEMTIRKSGEVYIVDVLGEMDLYNSYKLKDLISKMIEKDIKAFVINLDKVDYIDSSGIGVLIYICTTVKKADLQLAITNVHGSVQKVISLTKLNVFFPIVDTVDNAVEKLSDPDKKDD
ncbi:STAS domain-containing protein [Treponema parvum]|uniref:Anti-sigma factor antagonist n=1 Tax=Treponema parvum TaxID=138851 RepID=A0A975F3E4_9SPIR|nr:STAS domain-containing protein [Treponema parvum]QTQ13834.1 STAS domain-containing protein [Treponema parvum]QTQ16053.1 STAS domain-containing protein [Treponema parvum]